METLMKQCKNFKKYKGIRKPKCNKGEGCDACLKLYHINQSKKQRCLLTRIWYLKNRGFTDRQIGVEIGKTMRQVHYIIGRTYDYPESEV